ncbi:hypothetical protein ACET3X_002158 [Alternaria dauci]|uniref:Uncharacterized protein n=1 Tax=Alternaria dauci TaxID=48095 RepID=A0ABR3UNS0_9PLEO
MSGAALTDELPQLGASEMQPNLRFHPPHIFALFGPEHHHVVDTRSMTTLGYILVSSFENARQRLDSFQVLGFTDSTWQSKLTSSPALFHSMIKLPALRNLTFLKLELDMMAFENESMTSLVKMIKGNANLKALHLTAGPKGFQRWSSRSEDWAPLLLLLGSSPPFRLRSLEVDGLVTSLTAPTLARIVNVHSSSMRRVVLKHTNFHHPNTLREFFTACANSSIRYYMSENFLFHETRMLVGASLAFSIIRDDMHCNVECENIEQACCCDMFDTTCLDWVEVRFPTGGGRLLYDNEHGRYGDGWMYKAFMGGVTMVKDGAIIDF